MVYTEIKELRGRRYYYRVISIRRGDKVSKKRIYLGADLDKKEINMKEKDADLKLNQLNSLLSENEKKELEKIKNKHLEDNKEDLKSKYEAFCSLFTYDSTGIEGNTLTLQETAQLLFENSVPGGRSLREINESLNHKEAFDYILKNKRDISKEVILKLHEIVCKNTLKPELKGQIGKYRTVQVYIRGVEWLPPKPHEVPREMRNLFIWYSKNENIIHPLILAAYFHSAFETIHPFVDGNGRVGRLLMNLILRRNNYPMINIPNSRKLEYYNSLEKAQVKGDLRPLIKFLFELMINSRINF